jgi:predicted nucleic acid-binding protein
MCIVIDINVIAMVFQQDNARHSEFVAVKEWLDAKLGVVVYGGTKYKEELAKTIKHAKLLRLMRDGGRAITISDEAVDLIEKDVHAKTGGTDCDDQHVIALLGAARCSLLCSIDNRSFPFVHDKLLYPKGAPRVKIYTSPRNKRLLKKSDPSTLKNVC